MPIWHDGTAYVVAAPPQTAIPTAAAAAAASAHSALIEPVKKPRPRKPYTATKTREMWTPEEHARMLEGLKRHKRDWAKVTKFVGTRSAAQVRSHAQKYFDRVQRDKTDDYVPQARPKRKSASPYPRKMRPDTATATAAAPTITMQPQAATAHAQYYHIPTAQVAPIYSVPPAAYIAAAPPPAQVAGAPPQTYQYTMHHPTPMFATPQGMIPAHMYQQQLHPRQVHHVQHAIPTRPQYLLAHPMVATQPPPQQQKQQSGSVVASPNIAGKHSAQAVNGSGTNPGAVPVPPGTAMYSPMAAAPTGTIPPGAVPVARIIPSYIGHPSPQIGQIPPQAYPSPMSVDGRSYAVQPRSDEVLVMNNQPTMFAPHSPMTPAIPYGPSTPSSMLQATPTTTATTTATIVGTSTAATSTATTPHMPTHSHPNGPDPNCAKCNALKRYGNVLQEMGAIHKANIQKLPAGERNTKENGVDKQQQERNPGTPITPETATPPNVSQDFKSKPSTTTTNEEKTAPPPRPPKSPSPSLAQVSVLRIPKPYDASRPHHTIGKNNGAGVSVVGVKPSTGPGSSTGSLASVLTTDRDPKRLRDESNIGTEAEEGMKKRQKMSESTCITPPRASAAEQRELFDAVKSLQILGRSTSPKSR